MEIEYRSPLTTLRKRRPAMQRIFRWTAIAAFGYFIWWWLVEPRVFEVPPLSDSSGYSYRTSMSMVDVELQGRREPNAKGLHIAVPQAYLAQRSQHRGGFQRYLTLHANLEDLSSWSHFLAAYYETHDVKSYSKERRRVEFNKYAKNKIMIELRYALNKISKDQIGIWRQDELDRYKENISEENEKYIIYKPNLKKNNNKHISNEFILIPKSSYSIIKRISCHIKILFCRGTAYMDNNISLSFRILTKQVYKFESYEREMVNLVNKVVEIRR